MKPGQPLKSDPAKTREWQDRSRAKAASNRRVSEGGLRQSLRPGKRKSKAKIPDEIRNAAKRRTGGICVRPGCKRKAVHVHHWLDEQHFPELAKMVDNLSGSCSYCNWRHHFQPDGQFPFSAIPECTLRLAAKIGPRAQAHLDRYYAK